MTTPDPAPSNPISQKVYGGTLVGGALALTTWALTTYIPAWHSGIPPTLAALLPGLLGAIGYFGGGYLSKHRVTPKELAAALRELSVLNSAVSATVPSIPQGQPSATVSVVTPTGLGGQGSRNFVTAAPEGIGKLAGEEIPPELQK